MYAKIAFMKNFFFQGVGVPGGEFRLYFYSEKQRDWETDKKRDICKTIADYQTKSP